MGEGGGACGSFEVSHIKFWWFSFFDSRVGFWKIEILNPFPLEAVGLNEIFFSITYFIRSVFSENGFQMNEKLARPNIHTRLHRKLRQYRIVFSHMLELRLKIQNIFKGRCKNIWSEIEGLG